MLGTNDEEKVNNVPLSNGNISHRIEDKSSDLKSQICEHFKAPGDELSLLWSLQVHASMDISGKAQLLAFIRFIKDAQFENEYLFYKDIKTTTTG